MRPWLTAPQAWHLLSGLRVEGRHGLSSRSGPAQGEACSHVAPGTAGCSAWIAPARQSMELTDQMQNSSYRKNHSTIHKPVGMKLLWWLILCSIDGACLTRLAALAPHAGRCLGGIDPNWRARCGTHRNSLIIKWCQDTLSKVKH